MPNLDDFIPGTIRPNHYKHNGTECWDMIKATLGESYPSFLIGNVMKYLWRYREKNGVEDLRKAYTYMVELGKEAGFLNETAD